MRRIICIDLDKCDGCGRCVNACHEGALALIDGKATLVRDDYCDGMGDCLPQCHTGAIHFEEREADAYDAQAVAVHRASKQKADDRPGGDRRALRRTNWPVQLKLAPTRASYFDGAHLLVAADCTAYAFAAMHEALMRGRATLIGCPKLDGVNYSEKLMEILLANDITDVTVARMEVPCCGGLEVAVRRALRASGKPLPMRVVTVTVDGESVEGA